MATIILSAVGTAIGGPIGGAIGAALGQQVDNRILAPNRNREGPRLKELSVQTSSYGSQIPSVFGRMRVSGSVIWATDIQESRQREGGGKGRPSTTTFSYSANFAVALSSRKVSRLGRIWADGNLLRGASGALKSGGEYRFYSGVEEQQADPLIAADVGIQNCPAFRGISYVVFENLPLADFGNRIPQLTFEIFERDEAVAISDIANIASNGTIIGEIGAHVDGYAVEGDTAGNAIRQLIDIFPHQLLPEANRLRLAALNSIVPTEAQAYPASMVGEREVPPAEFSKLSAAENSPGLALRYYDSARDYQPGLQRASFRLPKSGEEVLSLPATLGQSAAKEIIDQILLRQEQGRMQLSVTLAAQPTIIAVGNQYFFDFAPDIIWQVDTAEIQHQAIKLDCVQVLPIALPQANIASDFYVTSPDREAGTTVFEIIDLPAPTGSNPSRSIVALAANGSGEDWRSAQILRKFGDGYVERTQTVGPSAGGVLLAPLAKHSGSYFDRDNKIEIQLFNSFSMPSENPAGLLSPLAPVISLGGELIRCGVVVMSGPDTVIISQLQRGAFGTENKIQPHLVGANVFFVEEDNIAIINDSDIHPGMTLKMGLLGRGDADILEKQAVVEGRAVTPLAPVHGRASLTEDGALTLKWTRRSHTDAGWNDFTDQINPEEDERYELLAGGIAPLIISGATHTFSASEAAMILASSGLESGIEVRQLGRHNISAPLVISLPD